MCGGLQFKRKKIQQDLGILEPEDELISVYFPNPKAALLVDEARDLWLPWGRRKEQPGDWPEGGWARAESLAKPYWTRWDPEPLLIYPVRWMEKDPARRTHWFALEPGQGIRCIRLHGALGTPLYVVTVPATGDFKAEIHDRMPGIS
ncbi:MAG TPA: hypothetical protein VJ623_13100 [Holophagaceae bacterium]|nr:hypothetical protein [Holophagaceae bacterium]